MSACPLELLRHIIDEIKYVETTISSLDRDTFLADETLKRSFVRSIEIIGEAAKKIPPHIKNTYPSVDWKRVTGMRDKLIHDYFGVDYDIVWDVARNKLPELKQHIMRILEREER